MRYGGISGYPKKIMHWGTFFKNYRSKLKRFMQQDIDEQLEPLPDDDPDILGYDEDLDWDWYEDFILEYEKWLKENNLEDSLENFDKWNSPNHENADTT